VAESQPPFRVMSCSPRGQQAQAYARQPTTEQEAAPRQSKLAGKQAATAVQLHALPWHEPALKTERILMVDFGSTQARAKEVAPPANREEGQADTAIAKSPSASLSLTTDGVDKMYHQLTEIHAIAAAQQEDCARWLRSDSTSRLVPSPLLISHPELCYGGRFGAVSPNLAMVARARCQSAARRARDRADIATSSGTRSSSHVASPHSVPPATRQSCFVLLREAGRRP
jgi:hypothetical protein